MPMTFSITGRSILLGRITSIDAVAGGAARSSLSFQIGLSLPQHWGWDGERPAFTYNYTKVRRAGELLRLSESPFSLRKIMAKLLPMSYPKTDGKRRLASLADNLALRLTTVPSIFIPEWIEHPVVHLEIIFLGQVSDRYASLVRGAATASSVASTSRAPASERKLPINVSAELMVFGDPWVTTSVMSLECVYDPEDGRMYLIGCRDVGHPWRNVPTTTSAGDLEDGMDCSVEVKVEYPPTTTHWFIWSAVKVHIASTRNAGDPLHFDTMRLRALPFQYPKPRPDELSRGIVNGVLCIVLLSASLAAGLSQLVHLKTHADVAPHVSLVMLCVQVVGLSMPLIKGMESLLARATLRSGIATMAPSSAGPSYSLTMNRTYQSIDTAVKVLSLAAFVLTRELIQKVRRSRALVLARSLPPEPGRVPGEAKVFLYHSAAHLLLFMLVVARNGRTITMEQHHGLMLTLA
ncbi:hypothetical protein C2845_PM04G30570 [Panicum miliaceum]|uniref:RING-type E3 ubiquitin transferase n=1 Tax=Panicum miliaceum TaxID=4540 RepID=A0A3L6QKW3_PANMI|nr:hypothetical protein C2845_PM04G30570 [Panicum miliaceum]